MLTVVVGCRSLGYKMHDTPLRNFKSRSRGNKNDTLVTGKARTCGRRLVMKKIDDTNSNPKHDGITTKKNWVTPLIQKAEIKVVTEGSSGALGDGGAGATKRP